MKKIKAKHFSVLTIALMLLLSQVVMMQAATVTAEDKTLTFITDVLQLDLTKYDAALSVQSVDYLEAGIRQEHVKYDLKAIESQGSALCIFNDGSLAACMASVTTGAILYTKQSENIVDRTRGILERYQTYSGRDLKQMIDMLQTVNADENEIITLGDLKLEVTSDDYHTLFNWQYSFNGVDYKAISIVYQDRSVFFSDDTNRFKIGDTEVNISRDQAIDIAMKYIETYSVTGIVTVDGKETFVELRDFNIAAELTKADLSTALRDSVTMEPCWRIELSLDQKQPYADFRYPSGIYALYVVIWANTGEVFSCTPLAVGGLSPEDAPTTAPLSPSSWIIGIAVILGIAIAATLALVYKKKRK
ncbi:MAG: hypothetical protein LBI79_03275 [Nitrososphaerota archaeon]|jgi:hypothetical protein|nr:hypothetical protein [Nitrososphaerota archaeon]